MYERNISRNNIRSFKMIFWSVFLATQIFSAISKITVHPRDTEAVVGQATFMNCSTSDLSKDISWYYYPPSQQGAIYIYFTGRIQSLYRNRAQLDINNDTGAFNLVIFEVQGTDSGRYLCQEEDQYGTAELVVLHTNPVCHSSVNLKELIGPNDCNIALDELQLSCTVAYSGNNAPVLEWKAIKENETVLGEITSEKKGNNATSHLTKEIDLSMNGSSYLCQTTGTAAVRQLAKPSCTSEVLHILYAFSQNLTVNASVGESIDCVANANVACNYIWKWVKGVDVTTESSSATLTPKKQGSHRCEATCKIRNHSCTIVSKTVLVSGNENEGTSSDSGLIAGIVSFVVFAVIVVVVLTAVVLIIRKRKKEEKDMLLQERRLDALDLKSVIPFLSFLAKGTSCEIYGLWDFDNKKCVWKKILLPTKIADNAREAEIRGKTEKWKDLDHNNLIRFHYVRFQSPALYILMDYAEGGTVRRALDSCTNNLPDNVVNDWATQIAEGMNYLHENNILHGQLKCGQILLMEHFNPSSVRTNVLKIGSFRLAAADSESVTKNVYQWMSPEMLNGRPCRKSSDIWSYGVTIWEILTRETPYKGVKFGMVVSEIISGSQNLQIPESCSPDLKDILKDCWNRDEAKRPTFPVILSRLYRSDHAKPSQHNSC